MSHHRPTRLPSLRPPRLGGVQLLIATGVILLPLLGMWIASQYPFWPIYPEAFATSLSVLSGTVLVMAMLWLSAIGIGSVMRHYLMPEAEPGWILSLALGQFAVLLVAWLLGHFAFLSPTTAWVIYGMGLILLVRKATDPRARKATDPATWPAPPWTMLLALPLLGLLLVAVTIPAGQMWRTEAFGYDVLLYHLQLPREWANMGHITGLEHNVYSYLPNLVEAGYFNILMLEANVGRMIYTAQVYHASFALLSGLLLFAVARRFVSAIPAGLALPLCLGLPWVIITGSLAYNEMVMIAFGAAGLFALVQPKVPMLRRGITVGLLCGPAILAKPTGGFMIVLPMLAVCFFKPWLLVIETDEEITSKSLIKQAQKAWLVALVIVATALLTISPYLVRNAIWTGNPVFPFAADWLGRGHWTTIQVERWNHGHHSPGLNLHALIALGRQWFFNTGFGGVGGFEHQGTEMARFPREFGLPLFWLLALAGLVLSLWRQSTRKVGLMLATFLAVQVLGWLLLTHQQARFMLPSLIPGVLLICLLFENLQRVEMIRASRMILPVSMAGVMVILTANCFDVFFTQTRKLRDHVTGNLVHQLPREVIGQMDILYLHPINTRLLPGKRVFLIADNQSLLYLNRPMLYHTVWDANPLEEWVAKSGNPLEFALLLRTQNIDAIWFSQSEWSRLRDPANFQPIYAPSVTDEQLANLVRPWIAPPEGLPNWPGQYFPERGNAILMYVPTFTSTQPPENTASE